VIVNKYGSYFSVCKNNKSWPVELQGAERKYDCFVINTNNSLLEDQIRIVATQLARSPCMWVETFGFGAERIHDAIDNEAVAIGRQSKAGDGNPMTSWNDESMNLCEFSSYAWTGGQGDSKWKVIWIIGNEEEASRISAAIESEALHSRPESEN
jgi:hypothetical protein